jgi:hypothetical protein
LPVLRVGLLPNTGSGSLSLTTSDSPVEIRTLAAVAAFRAQVTALSKKPQPQYEIVYHDNSSELATVINPYFSEPLVLTPNSVRKQRNINGAALDTGGVGYSPGNVIIEGYWRDGYVNGEYSSSVFIVTGITVTLGNYWTNLNKNRSLVN